MTKRIAHITDIHLDESDIIEKGVDPRGNWKRILKDVATKNVEEIVFAGDIGEDASLEWFFNSLSNYRDKVRITLGNHDTFSEVMRFYKSDVNKGDDELFYTDEDDHFKYIYLDSSSNAISDQQVYWLRGELETIKPVVLFIHHPVLPVETEMDIKYALAGREKIEEALRQHANRVYIFCGHYHTSDERTVGNITQFVTPAGSLQVVKQFGKVEFDTVAFGYRIINIRNGEIDTEVIDLA